MSSPPPGISAPPKKVTPQIKQDLLSCLPSEGLSMPNHCAIIGEGALPFNFKEARYFFFFACEHIFSHSSVIPICDVSFYCRPGPTRRRPTHPYHHGLALCFFSDWYPRPISTSCRISIILVANVPGFLTSYGATFPLFRLRKSIRTKRESRRLLPF